MEQRVEFVIRARQGEQQLAKLCREYGVSRPTGYLWLKRYQEVGSLSGLQERSRRPHRSPTRTERSTEERVLELRDKTGWGAPKLQHVLACRGLELTCTTVHRILVREGRVGPASVTKRATRRFARAQCNELAQMDFKGEYHLPAQGKCFPLTLLDDCSRYLHGLWPLTGTGGEGVIPMFTRVFSRAGSAAVTLDGSWQSLVQHHE